MQVHGTVFSIPYNSTICTFVSSLVAPGYNSSSDRSLKDNIEDLKAEDCNLILNAVSPKTYTRNDRNNERRVGFVAQDLQEVFAGTNFEHIVGKTTKSEKDADGKDIEGEEILTLDYSRISVILFGALKDTNRRVAELEHTILQMQQTAS